MRSARAPKGQQVKARGGTPGTTPHNVCCALKGHTRQASCGHRSPRWGEVSWGGVTQGSAPLHPGLSPCAALRQGRARDAHVRGGCIPKGPIADFRFLGPAVTTSNHCAKASARRTPHLANACPTVGRVSSRAAGESQVSRFKFQAGAESRPTPRLASSAFGQQARDPSSIEHRSQFRDFGTASRLCHRTAGMERTTRRRVQG